MQLSALSCCKLRSSQARARHKCRRCHIRTQKFCSAGCCFHCPSPINSRTKRARTTARAPAVSTFFCAYLGPHAPHYSADSPPWARDRFNTLAAPRTPAYNTSVGQADKAHHVAQNPPLDEEAEKWIDVHFRDRWRAISGVDDMMDLMLDHLEAKGVLASTFVFFSSGECRPGQTVSRSIPHMICSALYASQDHGYKLGEWRIGCSKQHPYESDVHVSQPVSQSASRVFSSFTLCVLLSPLLSPLFLLPIRSPSLSAAPASRRALASARSPPISTLLHQ